MTAALALYRGLTTAGLPLFLRLLSRRVKRGREDAARLGERMGRAGAPRPEGPLIWLHAASIGEAQSVLVLIERLLGQRSDLSVLLTTGTVTSARLMGERLPARARHQFVPLDRRTWVRAFLDHWRPDAALWVESELWPNMILETAARGIPMALVNARLSQTAHASWRRARKSAARLLAAFDIVLAQDEVTASRLRDLGAGEVAVTGTLKFAAAPLPADAAALAGMKSQLGDRPCWLAASVHPGEAEAVARVHLGLRGARPDLLTLVVPRHPARAPDFAAVMAQAGLTTAFRSAGEAPSGDVYIADTVGELGLFYRLAPVCFIGGSLVPHGGQNLLEAAQLDCAVVHGPNMQNFQTVATEMAAAGGCMEIAHAAGLAGAIEALLDDPARRTDLTAAARDMADAKGAVLDLALARLAPVLARLPAPPDADEAREPYQARSNHSDGAIL